MRRGMYFFVIVTSHFVVTVTLALGRVSSSVPLSLLWLITSNVHLSGQGSNPSQPRHHLPALHATILIMLFPCRDQ
jgi:hypothetical protein